MCIEASMQEVEWKHNDCVVTNAMGLYCISHHFTSKSIGTKVEPISKVIAGIPRDLIGNGRNDVEHRQERLESTGSISGASSIPQGNEEHWDVLGGLKPRSLFDGGGCVEGCSRH